MYTRQSTPEEILFIFNNEIAFLKNASEWSQSSNISFLNLLKLVGTEKEAYFPNNMPNKLCNALEVTCDVNYNYVLSGYIQNEKLSLVSWTGSPCSPLKNFNLDKDNIERFKQYYTNLAQKNTVLNTSHTNHQIPIGIPITPTASTTIPKSRIPTGIPIPTASTTIPKSHIPTGIPLPTASTTIPKSHIPTGIPLPTASTTIPKSRIPTGIPLPTASTTIPKSRIPTGIPLPTTSTTVSQSCSPATILIPLNSTPGSQNYTLNGTPVSTPSTPISQSRMGIPMIPVSTTVSPNSISSNIPQSIVTDHSILHSRQTVKTHASNTIVPTRNTTTTTSKKIKSKRITLQNGSKIPDNKIDEIVEHWILKPKKRQNDTQEAIQRKNIENESQNKRKKTDSGPDLVSSQPTDIVNCVEVSHIDKENETLSSPNASLTQIITPSINHNEITQKDIDNIPIKEEPLSTLSVTEDYHPILNPDLNELKEVVYILRGRLAASDNCTRLTAAILEYLDTGKKPTQAIGRFNVDLNHYETFCEFQVLPREYNIKKEINPDDPKKNTLMVSKSQINLHTIFGKKVPQEEFTLVDLEANREYPILDIENDKRKENRVYADELESKLIKEAKKNPHQISYGTVGLNRCAKSFIKQPGHLIAYYASAKQNAEFVIYIDCQRTGRYYSPIIQKPLKEIFPFVRNNEKITRETYGSLVFYTPIGPKPTKIITARNDQPNAEEVNIATLSTPRLSNKNT